MNKGDKQSVISGLSDAYATVFGTGVGKNEKTWEKCFPSL